MRRKAGALMPNANRTRAILAAQKVKRVDDPKSIENALKLTAEQRKAIYGPKPATSAPAYLQGNKWVNAYLMLEKITYGLTAFSGLWFGGLMLAESKKSVKQ